MTPADRSGTSRRAFLAGAATIGAAGAGLVAGCTNTGDDREDSLPNTDEQKRYVPFQGRHQTGITATPVPALGLMAAFSVVDPDRRALQSTLQRLTVEIRSLMSGAAIEQRDSAYPPIDSGVLGAKPPPDNLALVVSVGASLFDRRFGLAARRPRELVKMPFLANDRLDPARSHGDLLITIECESPDTQLFALRQVMRATRENLVLAWMIDGYTRGHAPADGSTGAPRNLLGFKDGTANLEATDAAAMDRHVWVTEADDEPDWAAGGSYHVARVIRMFVEFWDRTRLSEQEAIMGRHKITGAPLGQDGEFEIPAYASDPSDRTIPLDAHIRLANPRNAAAEEEKMLRRGFSYSRGFDGAGQLDQGLAFVSYQRSLVKSFLAVQERLAGEPLEEYILPEGGGFYFALPGVEDDSAYLGQSLLG